MVLDANQKQEIEELVQNAIEGNESAFGQIYDIYFEKIYRFVFYRVSHRETAEDLVAETFTRVWDKITEIENTGAFNGWVYQIARNLVIDYYRGKRENIDLATLENVLEYEDRAFDKTNLHFEQKIFLEHLKKLSEDQQAVIKLKFIDDLTNKEIAKILEKSEGAVRVIQHRALQELKKVVDSNLP